MINHHNFALGVNYWPRRTGVNMWRQFDPEAIRNEFCQIREMGMDTVRVFPLWCDFQPLHEIKSAHARRRGLVLGDICANQVASCGNAVDPVMMARFDQVVDAAGEFQLRLIVSLLTAWMSGTLFDPEWRANRAFFSDPFMLKWQMLYCREFARRYAGRPEILYWEYGNEQNCVQHCESPEAAWTWMQALANELRLHDPGRSISSGMHGLVVHPGMDTTSWGIRENAEVVDVLTTHPYPEFTAGCFLERLTDLRANLHATAQSRFYSGIGGRPVLCEETGSLGESVLSSESAADYLRLRLYSLWANGATGCLWWCFSDFACADQLPYRDVQMENDGLGLTTTEGKIRPAGQEMSSFRQILDQIGENLPEPERKTAIIVSDKYDFWEIYFTTYALCKQAGIEADFVFPDADLTNYRLLLCPSLTSFEYYDFPHWEKIMSAVADGCTLYLSADGASLTRMAQLFGVTQTDRIPNSREEDKVGFAVGLHPALNEISLPCRQKWRHELRQIDSEILARWSDSSPAVVKAKYGKGVAIFSGAAWEKDLAERPYGLDEVPLWRWYAALRDWAGVRQCVDLVDSQIERTYHRISAATGYLVLINHNRHAVSTSLITNDKLNMVTFAAGSAPVKIEHNTNTWDITIAGLQAAVLQIEWTVEEHHG